MNPTKPENDPRHPLDHVPAEQRQLHTNILALRENVKKLTIDLACRVHTAYIDRNSFNASSMSPQMTAIQRSDFATEFATAEAMLRTLENSAEFKAADAIVAPLLLAVAQLEAWEEQERQERARHEAELQSAKEAAKERALAGIENDSVVMAAKKKLQAFVSKI